MVVNIISIIFAIALGVFGRYAMFDFDGIGYNVGPVQIVAAILQFIVALQLITLSFPIVCCGQTKNKYVIQLEPTGTSTKSGVIKCENDLPSYDQTCGPVVKAV